MNTLSKGIGLGLVLATAAGTMVGFAALGSEQDEIVKLEDVPVAVRESIQRHAKGGTIEQIERSDEDGKIVYEIEVNGADGEFEFGVAHDGKFLGMDQDENDDHEGDDADNDDEQVTVIGLADAPAAVGDEFRRRAGAIKPSKVEKIIDEAVTKYEIEFDQAGGTASMTLSARGEAMEIESPVAASALPEAVRREIQKDYPGATIKAAESVQLFYYEMEIVVDGKTIEVAAFATGDIEDRLLGDETGNDEEHAEDGDEDGPDHHGEDDDD